jgi:hypothetical protein
MKLPMNSRKSRLVEPRFHLSFSQGISINHIGAIGGADGPSLDPPPKAEAPSIGAEVMQAEGSTLPADLEPDWRVPYLDRLSQGDLPLDKTEARWIARRAKTFVIYGNNKELYRSSPTGILQRCITNEEGKNLLKDLHSGLAVITRCLEPSSKTRFDKVFTGRPQSLTLLSKYAPAKDASTMQDKPISWLTPCKRFPSHGRSPFGDSTWSDP